MHPEADALLDAIFDHPDDDTPRLVYADWLQEHGRENYARFIRLQCAAARETPFSDEANRLWVEIGRVWRRLDEEWWPATRDEWLRLDWTLDAVHFDRGFLRPKMRLTDAQLQSYLAGDTCWTCVALPGCPLLLTPGGNWKELASLSPLRRIRQIRLVDVGEADPEWDSQWLPEELAALLQSEHLRNLTRLDLSRLCMTQRVADVLLSAPHLSGVEELVVSFAHGRGPVPDETVKQFETCFKNVAQCYDWDVE